MVVAGTAMPNGLSAGGDLLVIKGEVGEVCTL